MLDLVEKVCRKCEKPFQGYAEVPTQRDCPSCIDRAYAHRVNEAMENWRTATLAGVLGLVDAKLSENGMGNVERIAESEKVPAGLKRALPKTLVKALIDANVLEPTHGFGLSGGQGIGKTMCLAAIVRTRTDRIVRWLIDHQAAPPDPSDRPWHAPANFVWANWPERAAWAKAAVMKHGGAEIIEQFTQRAAATPLLVLDDLGRERMARGAYDEDFAFGILDRIVDMRSRARVPLLWTSNLTRAGLATRYGAALTSRLLGLAPAVELPKLADLRLA